MRRILTSLMVLLAYLFASTGGEPFKGYTFYRKMGVARGLKAEGAELTLNDENLRILGGSIHYFRVPKEHWRHRLQLLKTNGLNTVETYVPWNLHEPGPGIFDFGGTGGTDLLNIREFIQLAKELDLLVILRPGPYICAEWDFGGLPSWLLRWPGMQVRSTNADYLGRVAIFFDQLKQQVGDLQFTRDGPIIAVQIENEYGAYGSDVGYKTATKKQLEDAGFVELLFTSDQPGDLKAGSLEGVWMTVNGKDNVGSIVDQLIAMQKDKPRMVMEYWYLLEKGDGPLLYTEQKASENGCAKIAEPSLSVAFDEKEYRETSQNTSFHWRAGWFDHWRDEYHNGVPVDTFAQELRAILSRNASFNFYVYHGGTNFAFLNGANIDDDGKEFYKPDVTSYDYDTIVSEAGVPTVKWHRTQEVLKEFGLLADNLAPAPPAPIFATYGEKSVTEWLPLADVQKVMKGAMGPSPVLPMEELRYKKGAPANLTYGQSYGFISYKATLPNQDGKLVIQEMHDRAMIFVNGKHHHTIEFTESIKKDHSVELEKDDANKDLILTILVENLGRINYARNGQKMDNQKKGLQGSVTFAGQALSQWQISPMEFETDEVAKLSATNAGWTTNLTNVQTPAAFRIKFSTPEEPKDTFLNVHDWGKGVVFVNGRNIGRYWPSAGPQKTLYVPGVWLKPSGQENDIILFELEKYGTKVVFQNTHDLGPAAGGSVANLSAMTVIAALVTGLSKFLVR